jgi:putative transposase
MRSCIGRWDFCRRTDDGSRMSREVHVRFYEGLEVKFLQPTHPYIKVNGRWCYLYRAIDRSGALVDVRLSEKRDMAAAKAFFLSAKVVTGVTPARVTTDGHDSYPRAIRTELGADAKHRTNQYLNNRIEQDHRGIKGRYGPMRGFKSPESASRFCRWFDELRNHLQARSRRSRHLPTNARRHRFLIRGIVALRILEAA